MKNADVLSKPQPWTAPLKNAGLVGTGKGLQGVVSLVAFALAARQLGATDFGFFVLIHGIMFGLSHILRAQSWQAVLKYGTEALHDNDRKRLKNILRYTFSIDILAAIVGVVIALFLVTPLSAVIGLPSGQLGLVKLYWISIFLILLTPTQFGVLRLFNRFDLIAVQTVIGPFIRFAGTVFLYFFTSAGLPAYLLVWFAGTIAGRFCLFAMALYTLRDHDLDGHCYKPVHPLHNNSEAGIVRFILAHNLTSSLQAAREPVGLILIGGMLGPAAAGIFRIAQKFADILMKPAGKILIPAIFPEFAKYETGQGDKQHQHMIYKNIFVIGSLSLLVFAVLWLGGRQLIALIYGSDYLAAYKPMIWLCAAGLITILSYPLEPFLSAGRRLQTIILANAAGLLIFAGLLWSLSGIYGVTAAGIAALASVVINTVIMLAGGGYDMLKAPVQEGSRGFK